MKTKLNTSSLITQKNCGEARRRFHLVGISPPCAYYGDVAAFGEDVFSFVLSENRHSCRKSKICGLAGQSISGFMSIEAGME
ncbi:MAG: hypothetical protein ACYTFK_10490 [Planctomycetota bacterium]